MECNFNVLRMCDKYNLKSLIESYIYFNKMPPPPLQIYGILCLFLFYQCTRRGLGMN